MKFQGGRFPHFSLFPSFFPSYSLAPSLYREEGGEMGLEGSWFHLVLETRLIPCP